MSGSAPDYLPWKWRLARYSFKMSGTHPAGGRKPSRRDDIVARLVALAAFWAIASGVIHVLFLIVVVPVSGDTFTLTVINRRNVGDFEFGRGMVVVVTTGVAVLGVALAKSSWTLWHGGRRGGESLAVFAIIVAALSVFSTASGAVDVFARGLDDGPGMWILLPSALGWTVAFSMITIRWARNRKGAHVRSA